MPEKSNDILPVAAARKGKEAAWDVLFQRYRWPLYAFLTESIQDEQGALDLILHHYAAAQHDDLEWMDDFQVVPNAPVEQQVPRSDAAPGPQGWLDIRSRKGRAFPWSPIPNEKRKRHLECGGSTPLWIRQGYPTEHPSTCTVPWLQISNFHCASKQSGGVRGGGMECCMVPGFADRIQSGVEPPHSRMGLAFLSGFGIG